MWSILVWLSSFPLYCIIMIMFYNLIFYPKVFFIFFYKISHWHFLCVLYWKLRSNYFSHYSWENDWENVFPSQVLWMSNKKYEPSVLWLSLPWLKLPPHTVSSPSILCSNLFGRVSGNTEARWECLRSGWINRIHLCSSSRINFGSLLWNYLFHLQEINV